MRMSASASHRLWVSDARLVPLGRYWRSKPLVFKVGAAFPGGMRRGEGKRHAGGHFEGAVAVELKCRGPP